LLNANMNLIAGLVLYEGLESSIRHCIA
jgi:hypothetical protein